MEDALLDKCAECGIAACIFGVVDGEMGSEFVCDAWRNPADFAASDEMLQSAVEREIGAAAVESKGAKSDDELSRRTV